MRKKHMRAKVQKIKTLYFEQSELSFKLDSYQRKLTKLTTKLELQKSLLTPEERAEIVAKRAETWKLVLSHNSKIMSKQREIYILMNEIL